MSKEKVTNFEYFKDEIIDILSVPHHTASSLAVVDGGPKRCSEVDCTKCDLNYSIDGETNCTKKRKAWLNAEHIEKPKLTKKERMFCELVETGWIARDKDDKLYHHKSKPIKGTYDWFGGAFDICISNTTISDCKISFITWDDEEPWSVEELLKLEVEQ